MAYRYYEKNVKITESELRRTYYNWKEDETKLNLPRVQRQSERTQRGESFDEGITSEAELQPRKKQQKCREKKASPARKKSKDECSIPNKIQQLTASNQRMKEEISQLRRDHEVVRCRGVACFVYEDAMPWFSHFFRKSMYKIRKDFVSKAVMDKLISMVKEKVVSLTLLSELVFLYKQFRPHPAYLIPVELKKPTLENAILAEYMQAKTRVKALTDQYRNTARDLRLAEDAIKTTHGDLHAQARKEKTDAKAPAPKVAPSPQPFDKEEREPLIPSQILEIVEAYERAKHSAEDATAGDAGRAKKRSHVFADCAVDLSAKERFALHRQSDESFVSEAQPRFRRPVKQMKQKMLAVQTAVNHVRCV